MFDLIYFLLIGLATDSLNWAWAVSCRSGRTTPTEMTVGR